MSTGNSLLFDTSKLAFFTPAKVALVCTDWNGQIVAEQIAGCERVISSYNCSILEKVVVPGSFEIPFGCRLLWDFYSTKTVKPEAIIAFGAVIKGGTPHFEYVCRAVTDGIVQLNLTLPIPVIFGVLTLNDETEAWERLGGKHGHKGEEAAITALKMIYLYRTYSPK